MRLFVVALYATFTSLSYAGIAVQSGWSGGDGVPGPVTNWIESFLGSENIQCFSDPGSLQLEYEPIKQNVDSTYLGPWSVYAIDIDNDADMDILSVSYYIDEVAWWGNTEGLGTDWLEHTICSSLEGAITVYSEDMDGDGDFDVLAAGHIVDEIVLWENLDGSGLDWAVHIVASDYTSARTVYAADMDGDQDMDVIGACDIANDVSWWENVDGLGTEWQKHQIDSNYNTIRSVYAADVDGDGDFDVLGAGSSTSRIIWWENTYGSGLSWSEHMIDSNFVFANEVRASDMDNDGDIDVLGAAKGSAEISWWENTEGSGIDWLKHTICNDLSNAYTICADDLDGDGDIDVVAGGLDAYEIRWWERLSISEDIWVEHIVDDYVSAPASVNTADINGDGVIDIIGCAVNSGTLSWWDVFVYPSSGSLESSILDLQEHPEWFAVTWNGIEPAETDIAFQFRTSSEPENMGSWSDTLFSPCCISDIVSDGDSLFQYKAMLFSTSAYFTPALEDILISWDPSGIENEDFFTHLLHGVFPNPAVDSPVLLFTLAEPSLVFISVFDLSGRRIDLLINELEEGQHSVNLEVLSPGIYFVRMQAENFDDACKFIMIE